MILSDFLVETKYGYYCSYGDFYIDPQRPVEKAVVSHAHGDHAISGNYHVYSTEPTWLFMKARYGKKLTYTTPHLKEYHQSFKMGEVELRFIPAGHMLGSAQILMQYKGVSYLYTGDYKLSVDKTCESIEACKVDVLITETTFARPEVVHPDPKEEILKLKNQKSKILLGCYALGKAQSLTALLNEYCPELEVFVHRSMDKFHAIYQKKGFVPLNYKPYGRREFREGNHQKVYLVPPMVFRNFFKAHDLIRSFASGWERLQESNGIPLYISDHVDWPQLIEYIGAVEPREIWTVHGEGSVLKEHFTSEMNVRGLLKQ